MPVDPKVLAALLLLVGREAIIEMLTVLIGPQPWWVWGMITAVCFGGAGLLIMPSAWRARIWARAGFRISWKFVAYVATAIVLLQFFTQRWDAIVGRATEIAGGFMVLLPDPPNLDHLYTRPTCEAECDNLDFRVRDCEVAAVEVGGLHRPSPRQRRERPAPRGDVDIATEYFRGCLVNQGLSWTSCECGDPGCLLLREFRTGYIPSFLCEGPE